MEPHLIVTLARLREAAELYRQLETARRDQAVGPVGEQDLAALAQEYTDDLAETRHQGRQLHQQARRLEDELQQLEAKLQDRRQRQTGDAGTVLALAAEIAVLQRRRDALEQQILELWQKGETAAGALAAERAAAAQAQQRLACRRQELQDRSRRAERAVPEIDAELAHLLRQLPRPVAGRLAQIARRHSDPVADLNQGACAGCGQNLPLQQAFDADREAALIVCQGCGRFIVPRSSRRTRD